MTEDPEAVRTASDGDIVRQLDNHELGTTILTPGGFYPLFMTSLIYHMSSSTGLSLTHLSLSSMSPTLTSAPVSPLLNLQMEP